MAEKKNDIKVFIAEDEVFILTWLQMELTEMGYDVVGTATDGRSAVEGVLKTVPDLFIADINMPVLSGLEAIEEIAKEMFIPSVIITAYTDPDFIEKANELGVYGYLVKPINRSELDTTIRIALGRFRDSEELHKEINRVNQKLADRIYIEKAKGIIMERFGVSEPQALAQMQKQSRDKNMKLIAVAKKIIEADEKMF